MQPFGIWGVSKITEGLDHCGVCNCGKLPYNFAILLSQNDKQKGGVADAHCIPTKLIVSL
jgi:hypothetical protein